MRKGTYVYKLSGVDLASDFQMWIISFFSIPNSHYFFRLSIHKLQAEHSLRNQSISINKSLKYAKLSSCQDLSKRKDDTFFILQTFFQHSKDFTKRQNNREQFFFSYFLQRFFSIQSHRALLVATVFIFIFSLRWVGFSSTFCFLFLSLCLLSTDLF